MLASTPLILRKSRMRRRACTDLGGGAISDGRPYRDSNPSGRKTHFSLMANHSRNFISRRWGPAAYEETQPHRTEQSNKTPFLDLDQAKTAVTDSLRSPGSRRYYEHTIAEFLDWYCNWREGDWRMERL